VSDKAFGAAVRMLSVFVIALSIAVFIVGGYAYLLKQENDNYRLIVEEIRNSVNPTIAATEPQEPSLEPLKKEIEKLEEASPDKEMAVEEPERHFFLESFDYERLIIDSFDYFVQGTAFSYVVVDENTAFKLCIEKGKDNYFITKIDPGNYGIMFLGENPLEGLFASKVAYGVQLVSHTIVDGIAPQIINLRANGYPAFAYKFYTTDGRTFYAAILGAFPDLETARDYSEALNVFKVEEITGWDISGRYLRRIK
jgi:hypothetical protein